MSHSLTKIWLHGIFSTKDRAGLIKPEFETKIYKHIQERLEEDFECRVRAINGMEEHLHILFLLSTKFSVENIFKNIKGESSHWINQSGFLRTKFAWQTGYGAFSISESMIQEVEKYIINQKEHHKKMSYTEEVELLIKRYGLGNR